jgi:hypothetical protein
VASKAISIDSVTANRPASQTDIRTSQVVIRTRRGTPCNGSRTVQLGLAVRSKLATMAGTSRTVVHGVPIAREKVVASVSSP